MSRLLKREDSVLLVCDIQDALVPHIFNHETLIPTVCYLVRVASQLGVPIRLTEQYPKGLGRTNAAILEALPKDVPPIEKLEFSGWREERVRAAMPLSRKTLVLAGIETHICMMQTALGALEAGWRVALAADAAGSRRESDHLTALLRLREAGVIIGTAEAFVYEWIGRAGTDEFRALLPLLKAGPTTGKKE
ncbi:MAG: isochorismatase family protein [Candidatus Sumerlaeota bacterium]|nr:isochorismatase family protein [Candidatus Sumerlaeota bacterium]